MTNKATPMVSLQFKTILQIFFDLIICSLRYLIGWIPKYTLYINCIAKTE